MDGFEKRNKRHLLDKWDQAIDSHNRSSAASQEFEAEKSQRERALRAHEDEQKAIQTLHSHSPISISGGHLTKLNAGQKVTALRNSRGSERPENVKPEERQYKRARQRQRTHERSERTR